jgi:hypothetical protein
MVLHDGMKWSLTLKELERFLNTVLSKKGRVGAFPSFLEIHHLLISEEIFHLTKLSLLDELPKKRRRSMTSFSLHCHSHAWKSDGQGRMRRRFIHGLQSVVRESLGVQKERSFIHQRSFRGSSLSDVLSSVKLLHLSILLYD